MPLIMDYYIGGHAVTKYFFGVCFFACFSLIFYQAAAHNNFKSDAKACS